MENNFAQKLILKIVHHTFFDKNLPDHDKLYFSKDFLREHSCFLNSNDFRNQWLRVNIVQVLFELEPEEQGLLRAFFLDNLSIVRNIITFQSNRTEPSDKEIEKLLDFLLNRFQNDGVVEGILIECICTKLEDLSVISDEYLIKAYITKEDFDDLMEFYLS